MKYFTILLTTLILVACSEEVEVDFMQIDEREGVAYKENSNKKFTGVAVSYDDSGQISSRTSYKNGILNGNEEFYNEGQIYRTTYKNGVEISFELICADGERAYVTRFNDTGEETTEFFIDFCSEDLDSVDSKSEDSVESKSEKILNIAVLFHGINGKEIQYPFDLSLFKRDGIFLKCSNPRERETKIGPIRVKNISEVDGKYEYLDAPSIIFLTNKNAENFTSMFVIQESYTTEKDRNGDAVYMEMYEGNMKDFTSSYYIYFTEWRKVTTPILEYGADLSHFIELKRDDLSLTYRSYDEDDEYDNQGNLGVNGFGECNTVDIDPISEFTEIFENFKKRREAQRLEREALEKATREKNKIWSIKKWN